MLSDIATNDIRHFNRYYTNKLGLLARYRFNTQLSLTEARVLLEISRRGLHTQGALGSELSIDGGYLNRVITKLGDIGLIQKQKDTTDGRVVFLELSAKGISQVQAINEASDDDAATLIEGLSDSEKTELIKHMRSIERILEGFGSLSPLIKPVLSAQDTAATRVLMSEYVTSLGENLSFQDIETELANLPDGYSTPTGALFIARLTSRNNNESSNTIIGEPTGCVALHSIGDGICEMKRLFVRPEYRGYGIGKALANKIIDEGRLLGYTRMRLDTLGRLEEAVSLYRKLGFEEIPPYYDNPLRGALFFEKVL